MELHGVDFDGRRRLRIAEGSNCSAREDSSLQLRDR